MYGTYRSGRKLRKSVEVGYLNEDGLTLAIYDHFRPSTNTAWLLKPGELPLFNLLAHCRMISSLFTAARISSRSGGPRSTGAASCPCNPSSTHRHSQQQDTPPLPDSACRQRSQRINFFRASCSFRARFRVLKIN